jgi:hypothetical protein
MSCLYSLTLDALLIFAFFLLVFVIGLGVGLMTRG